MSGFGSWNPLRDPMRNAGLSSQFIDYENKRSSTPISDKQRKIAYVLLAILGMLLLGVIALFFIM